MEHESTSTLSSLSVRVHPSSQRSRKGKPDKILSWQGCKYGRRDLIAAYVPADVSSLVSPFFGGGAVELGLLRQRPELKIKASALRAPLVRFWQQMLISPRNVVDKLEEDIPVTRVASESLWHENTKQHSAAMNDVEGDSIAAQFWIVHQLSFGGRMMPCYLYAAASHKLLRDRSKNASSTCGALNPCREKGRL